MQRYWSEIIQRIQRGAGKVTYRARRSDMLSNKISPFILQERICFSVQKADAFSGLIQGSGQNMASLGKENRACTLVSLIPRAFNGINSSCLMNNHLQISWVSHLTHRNIMLDIFILMHVQHFYKFP